MVNILFISKRRDDYNAKVHTKEGLHTGLFNSIYFVNNMLLKNNINSKMVTVLDNNFIDKEVTEFKPDYCIIEALWVVPSKFAILTKLHPTVKWIIRLHSEMPFMANEGIAMDWIMDYVTFPNVYVGVNAPRFYHEIHKLLEIIYDCDFANDKLFYLPNYYPIDFKHPKQIDKNKEFLDIGCFGAIRPFKNHLTQAVAALSFAYEYNKGLNFHINPERLEMNGAPVYNNLKGLFQHLDSSKYKLILHDWQIHDDFLKTVSEMDLGMQVSFSETFNIVGADFVSQGVPFIGSSEIPWLAPMMQADPTNRSNIVVTMKNALDFDGFFEKTYRNHYVKENQHLLKKYSEKTENIWLEFFDKNH